MAGFAGRHPEKAGGTEREEADGSQPGQLRNLDPGQGLLHFKEREEIMYSSEEKKTYMEAAFAEAEKGPPAR